MYNNTMARENVFSLQTSVSLTRHMNVKVAKELYQNIDTSNFSLTLSI